MTNHWASSSENSLKNQGEIPFSTRTFVGVKRVEESVDLAVKDYRKKHRESKW